MFPRVVAAAAFDGLHARRFVARRRHRRFAVGLVELSTQHGDGGGRGRNSGRGLTAAPPSHGSFSFLYFFFSSFLPVGVYTPLRKRSFRTSLVVGTPDDDVFAPEPAAHVRESKTHGLLPHKGAFYKYRRTLGVPCTLRVSVYFCYFSLCSHSSPEWASGGHGTVHGNGRENNNTASLLPRDLGIRDENTITIRMRRCVDT